MFSRTCAGTKVKRGQLQSSDSGNGVPGEGGERLYLLRGGQKNPHPCSKPPTLQ